MNILITGGCGFIGRNLITYLFNLTEKVSIRVFDNFKTGKKEYLRDICAYTLPAPPQCEHEWPVNQRKIELVEGDICDKKSVEQSFVGADVVIHLAANTGVPASVKYPEMDCRVNVLGTLNCLEASRKYGVKRFIFASSGAPLGECTPPIHEELAPHPKSPYGASKLAGEGYCSAYSGSYGLSTVVLRFGNVYGPFSYHKGSVVAKFIKNVLQHEPLTIFGDGGQTRDYIYVEDLVKAIYSALKAENIEHEIFQIATSAETTVNELVASLFLCLDRMGINKPEVINAASRAGDVKRNFSDTGKAASVLGWKAATSLEEGLYKTIQWFVNRE